MALEAHGKLAALTSHPRFDDVTLRSRALDFDTMRRLFPALDRRVGVVLHGPLALSLEAGGAALAPTVPGRVDLTGAAPAGPGVVCKPARAGPTPALPGR